MNFLENFRQDLSVSNNEDRALEVLFKRMPIREKLKKQFLWEIKNQAMLRHLCPYAFCQNHVNKYLNLEFAQQADLCFDSSLSRIAKMSMFILSQKVNHQEEPEIAGANATNGIFLGLLHRENEV